MAERTTSSLQILFLLALSLCLQSSISRTATTATSVLDVSASIRRTLDYQSVNFTKHNEPTILIPYSLSNSSALSLSLHSRSSLLAKPHNDYESFILSRLTRDSARVNSICLSLARVNSSVIMSSAKSLTAPVISRGAHGSGEYFAQIGIGEPTKYYYWVIDTGSDVSWLQCLPCKNCYQQLSPIYDPSRSYTYNSLSCNSPQCWALRGSGCLAGSCQYTVLYGDGSSTTGSLAVENLSFGSSGSINKISIGCGHDNQGLFSGAAGLIGLGGGSLSLPSQLDATSFSYCLVDSAPTPSSTLEFNSGRLANPITATLVRNPRYPTYRYLNLIGVSVGGRPLAISQWLFAINPSGWGGTIIDSGTVVTRLRKPAYEALRDEFVGQAWNLPRTAGFSLFDTCYDLSGRRNVAIPTVWFNFPRGQTLKLRAESVLVPVDSRGKFCLAFAPTNMRLSIIGNIQQETTRVHFDLANSVVGFNPDQC